MKKHCNSILFFLVICICQHLDAQNFNIRTRNDFLATEHFNLFILGDTIITVGFAVPPYLPLPAKVNITKYSLDGEVGTSEALKLDSLKEYFPLLQGASKLSGNELLIVGSGGYNALNQESFVLKYNLLTSKEILIHFEPLQNSITNAANASVRSLDARYVLVTDRVSGNKFTARLVKLDTSLNILWEKHYSDPEWNYTPFSMIMDKDSNLIVGLQQSIKGTVTEEDNINSIVWKLDKEGELIDSFRAQNWTYGPNKILQSADGGYMFVDRIHLEKDGGGDFLFRSRIVKLDADLDYEWEQQLGLLFQGTELYNIKALKDGNYIAVGKTSNLELEDPCSCGHVVKFSESGDIIWESFIGKKIPLDNENTFTQNRFYDIVELDSGGFVACGASYGVQVDSFPQQAWLVRMDEKGQVVSQWDIPRAEPSVNVQIVPNPAQDLVRIRIEDDEILERYELYDQQGAIVQSGFPKQVAEVLDVSRLPAGVYYIRVNGQSVGKMVKQ